MQENRSGQYPRNNLESPSNVAQNLDHVLLSCSLNEQAKQLETAVQEKHLYHSQCKLLVEENENLRKALHLATSKNNQNLGSEHKDQALQTETTNLEILQLEEYVSQLQEKLIQRNQQIEGKKSQYLTSLSKLQQEINSLKQLALTERDRGSLEKLTGTGKGFTPERIQDENSRKMENQQKSNRSPIQVATKRSALEEIQLSNYALKYDGAEFPFGSIESDKKFQSYSH